MRKSNTIQVLQQRNKNKRYNGSFDIFLAQSFELSLKKDIGAKKFRKIQKISLEMFEQDISGCITTNNFGRVLIFISDALGKKINVALDMMEQIATKLITIPKDNKSTITIYDNNLYDKIMLAYGNAQKKKILDVLYDKSMPLDDIPKHVNMSQRIYNKHSQELIRDGLLVTLDGDCDDVQAIKYTAVFSDVLVSLYRYKKRIDVIVKDEFLVTSCIYRSHHDAKKFRKRMVYQLGLCKIKR